jgi:hypothetical protein
MSRGSGSSVIPIALLLAILLIVLPVSADNITTSQTTIATTQTTVATTQTTVAANQTTVATTQTTVAANQTTIATSPTTATPAVTTVAVTRPTTVVTPAKPTISSVETIATGSVNVYSSPTGASILIDGVYSGTTPRTVNVLSAGNHILRLSLSGYNDYEGSIYVIPGQMAQGYGTLQPISQVVSAAPTTAVVVPVIIPVTPTPVPTQDPGPLGNSTVIAAIIGSVTVIIASAATIFTHVRPPKKE